MLFRSTHRTFPHHIRDTGQAHQLRQSPSSHPSAHPVPDTRQQGIPANAKHEKARLSRGGVRGNGDQQQPYSSLGHHAILSTQAPFMTHMTHKNTNFYNNEYNIYFYLYIYIILYKV